MHTCPGEMLSFICFANNATDVQWNIQFTRSLTADVRVTLIEDDPIAQLYNVTREGHVFSFNILSQNPMISELITTAATVIDGAVVQCRDVSSHNKNVVFDSSNIFIIDQGEQFFSLNVVLATIASITIKLNNFLHPHYYSSTFSYKYCIASVSQ